jgi:hypothetical protein
MAKMLKIESCMLCKFIRRCEHCDTESVELDIIPGPTCPLDDWPEERVCTAAMGKGIPTYWHMSCGNTIHIVSGLGTYCKHCGGKIKIKEG